MLIINMRKFYKPASKGIFMRLGRAARVGLKPGMSLCKIPELTLNSCSSTERWF